MLSVEQKIYEDWKAAIKNKDALAKKVLNFARSKMKEKAKEAQVDSLSDNDAIQVLRKMAKEQEEFVSEYPTEEAQAELALLKSYLPQLMDENSIRETVNQLISDSGMDLANANFGQVMGLAMKELKAKADGKLVRKVVQDILS